MREPKVVDASAVFELEGVELTVAGNTPFLLNEPGSVWIVHTGRVEVFSVEVSDGEQHGPRSHYLTADPGAALFGIDLGRYGEGLGLMAVGVVGTRLRKVALEQLQRDPELATDLIDEWVSGLSRGVTKTIVPQPRADAWLQPGEEGLLGTGGRARSRRGVVWVSHRTGSSLFIGMEDLPDTRPDAVFPITPDSFLQAVQPSTLAAVDTRAALTSGEAWAGLESFYQALFRCEFFNTRLAAADALNRLKDKAARDRRATEGALVSLAGVVNQRPVEFDVSAIEDPLLAACTVIGHRLELAIAAPPRPKEGETRSDPLSEIVRASRIRHRRVLLKDDWWRQESSPLLAFIEEGKRPVALLPASPGRFHLYDPRSGAHLRVTAEVAATLEPAAFTFYRPFPDASLGPRDVFRFGMSGNRRDLVRPLVVAIAGGFLGMIPPFFMGQLITTTIPQGDRSQLLQLALILVVVGITTTTFAVVRQLSVLRLEAKMSASLQPALWDRLLGLPIAFFRQFTAGDLAQRVLCVDGMRRILSGPTVSSLMTSVFSMFLIGQLFYYNWRLALVGLGLIVLAMLMTGVFGWFRLRLQRESTRIEGKISGLVLQLLSGIAKLRVAGAEQRAFAVWAKSFTVQKRLSLRGGQVETSMAVRDSVFPVLSSMLIFGMVVYFAAAALEAQEPPMTPGDFVAFNTAFGSVLAQILELGLAIMSMLGVIPLFERAKPIFDAHPEVDVTKSEPGELDGRIDIEHVTFRYQADGPVILDDVSIHMNPGTYIAVVGPSGSGKSTLIRLLLGLETPESGSIYYSGRDLSQTDVQKLRRKMGVVMQTGRIRPGSIMDNIVGSTGLTLDDAWQAVRDAGMEDDIKAMPMGLQTVLQLGGLTLSGGQRQRLMIARAIAHKPRILIFDEATSALDNRTQAIVTASLERLQATRIVVAHRLSTIIGADRIYVMQGGRIVQSGTYGELAEQDGLFADLIKRQIA